MESGSNFHQENELFPVLPLKFSFHFLHQWTISYLLSCHSTTSQSYNLARFARPTLVGRGCIVWTNLHLINVSPAMDVPSLAKFYHERWYNGMERGTRIVNGTKSENWSSVRKRKLGHFFSGIVSQFPKNIYILFPKLLIYVHRSRKIDILKGRV